MFLRGFKTWCENASASLRSELKLQPVDPLNPRALAEHLEVVVWQAEEIPGIDDGTLNVLLKEDPGSWSAVTVQVDGQAAVVLNSSHSAARTASNLTHEISHLVLGHEPARMDISEDGLLMLHTYDRGQEDEANWLGGCLLLPRDALLFAVGKGWSESETVTHFGVSTEMLRYRTQVTGVERQLGRRKRTRR
jgi:Zn-dependent peptidase ImmA (M78 family)